MFILKICWTFCGLVVICNIAFFSFTVIIVLNSKDLFNLNWWCQRCYDLMFVRPMTGLSDICCWSPDGFVGGRYFFLILMLYPGQWYNGLVTESRTRKWFLEDRQGFFVWDSIRTIDREPCLEFGLLRVIVIVEVINSGSKVMFYFTI